MILLLGLFSIMEMRILKQQMHEDVFLLTDTSIFGNDKQENMRGLIRMNENRILYVLIFTYKLELFLGILQTNNVLVSILCDGITMNSSLKFLHDG